MFGWPQWTEFDNSDTQCQFVVSHGVCEQFLCHSTYVAT